MRISTQAKQWAVAVAAGLLFSSAQAQTAQEFSFWIRASDAGFVEPMVKTWNASHASKAVLTVIPNDDFVTKFGTAVAGGAAPDVVAIDLIFVPAFAAAGQLSDVTADANALPFAKTLSPSHVRLAKYDGKQFAVPFSAESSLLLYNKALFKRAGLDAEKPPKTMAELEAAARKIAALGKGVKGFYFSGACGGCNIFTLTPYVWASGGDILSADGKQETLDNPALRNTLSMYRRLWTDGAMPGGAKTDNGANFISPFFTGKIGMVGTGAFAIGLLKKEHPEIDFGVAPLPGDKGGTSSFAGGDSIAIPAASKHKKEAWEFIQWALSEEVQVEQFAKNGSIPVRSDLADNSYSKQDARFAMASAAMQAGRTPYSAKFNQLINDPNGPWLAMIQEAVFGKGVDVAIKDAQVSFRKILAAP
ncbi:MAG: sugar ABC transporter substrate-binding protein [Rhodoferax sp.]|uniref:ABC transporter substrate-binding protein n=1 Tax=Rhodoferax sp. TaxID=50421 RepID=UPI0032653514